MGIGASIFMLAVGAILTFAFNIRVGFLDLDAVGWILMGAGVLGLILTLTVFNSRRRTVTSTHRRSLRRRSPGGRSASGRGGQLRGRPPAVAAPQTERRVPPHTGRGALRCCGRAVCVRAVCVREIGRTADDCGATCQSGAGNARESMAEVRPRRDADLEDPCRSTQTSTRSSTRRTRRRASANSSTPRWTRWPASARVTPQLLQEAFNIKTVGDLGRNKYFRAAAALVDLAERAK